MISWACVALAAAQTLPCVADGRALGERQAVELARSVVAALGPAVGKIVVKPARNPRAAPTSSRDERLITILIGDSRAAGVPGVYGNCDADSRTRTIRCDARLLDDLIDGFALARDETERAQLRHRLLCIVLAHELGHIVQGHPGRYHGTADGFSVFKYVEYSVELQADSFAIEQIDRMSRRTDAYYIAVVDLATAALRKSLCPDTFPAPCPCINSDDATMCSRVPLGPGLLIAEGDQVAVELVGSHPDFVVRFARMLHLSTSRKFGPIYGAEARRVLHQVQVRNELGVLESTDALFK